MLKEAACGLDCNKCNLCKAEQRAAAEALVPLLRARGIIGPEDEAEAVQEKAPLCRGCWQKGGAHWCGECRLRDCCEEKGIESCGLCADFPCAHYLAWIGGQPHHQRALEYLLSGRNE